MSKVAVRAVTKEDFANWSVLWEGYNQFYERTGPNALPEAVTLRTWSRFFDGYEPVHALVAELDGRLVGLAHYLYHRTTSRIEASCYLNDLFTSPDVRGQGVGRALIEAVYEQAKLAGSTVVYWQTHETNETAQKLYSQVADRSGFIVYRKSLAQ
ncbi:MULTISPECIES: GNAT family N-acetyltransferase [Undibacterium]|uniref:GNAT family N-acetyltransferase n=1 Tax=Undibacterium umbellatum TaxID=2762300 RepID=A0ABR6ZC05_9BURK|nr:MULTISPECIES: GNAT family N-acetyltransferase [Undibacterium]MBC3909275.1 GNAT family N-acetyltransferase [Undibacterium umbellatum]MDP1977333.1 GNAT family N-acetyltransferase [Undibacterium sp.]